MNLLSQPNGHGITITSVQTSHRPALPLKQRLVKVARFPPALTAGNWGISAKRGAYIAIADSPASQTLPFVERCYVDPMIMVSILPKFLARNAPVILVLCLISTIFFRFMPEPEKKNFHNLDATVHALLTMQAMAETPARIHKFLPTVTLGAEKNKFVWWGGTKFDAHGNGIYTSFPPLGFAIPHMVLTAFDADFTLHNLFFFSVSIHILAVLLAFQLAKIIGASLLLNKTSTNVAALFATVPYIFSTEALYSHGYVYWSQSLFQVFFLIFLLVSARIGFSARPSQSGFSAALAFSVMLMCLTEWTGFLVAAGAPITLWLKNTVPLDTRRRYMIVVFSTAAISGLLLIVWFASSIGLSTMLEALFSRFKSRGIDSSATIGALLKSYGGSFGLFLAIAVMGLLATYRARNLRNLQLLMFILTAATVAIFENFLMKQHATEYHYDRLKFLVFFTALVPAIWLIPGRLTKLVTTGIVVVASSIALANYKTARFYPDIPVDENAVFVHAAKFDDAMITTPYQVRGAIALMFHQNVHQDVSIGQAGELALSKQKSVISIDADMLENQALRIHGLYRFNKLGDIEYISRKRCDDRHHFNAAFVVQTCKLAEEGLYTRMLTRYTAPALRKLDLTSDKLQPFNLTDASWVNGIARPEMGAVFFVARSDLAVDVYLRRTKELSVDFGDGDVRQVVAAYPAGDFINVYVDGPALIIGNARSAGRIIIREKSPARQ